jgi:two-component sensor histidine kinase
MALHELAINATKYGALSCPEGRVSVQWGIERGMLQLDWEESGGPPVAPPTKKGFGSRLLEDRLIRDLAGTPSSFAMSPACDAVSLPPFR